MNDYSQNGEQAIILDFFKDKPKGRFLDLGAYDGITGSNTRSLAELGWEGVCVEASPYIFPKLVEAYSGNRNVECLLGAVHVQGGPVFFHENLGQKSTCLFEHGLGPDAVHSFFVSTISTQTIWYAFGSRFDFISIDLEGIDLIVLRQLAPLVKNTQLLCVEHAIPNKPFDERYYGELLEASAIHGFTKVIGRTAANTLIAR